MQTTQRIHIHLNSHLQLTMSNVKKKPFLVLRPPPKLINISNNAVVKWTNVKEKHSSWWKAECFGIFGKCFLHLLIATCLKLICKTGKLSKFVITVTNKIFVVLPSRIARAATARCVYHRLHRMRWNKL